MNDQLYSSRHKENHPVIMTGNISAGWMGGWMAIGLMDNLRPPPALDNYRRTAVPALKAQCKTKTLVRTAPYGRHVLKSAYLSVCVCAGGCVQQDLLTYSLSSISSSSESNGIIHHASITRERRTIASLIIDIKHANLIFFFLHPPFGVVYCSVLHHTARRKHERTMS